MKRKIYLVFTEFLSMLEIKDDLLDGNGGESSQHEEWEKPGAPANGMGGATPDWE